MAQISNPRKRFNFSIQIVPDPINPFLAQKVTIPEINLDATAHGDTNHDINTAGRISYGKVIIEKISTTSGADNYFFDWMYSAQDPIIGGGLSAPLYKRVVNIQELAEDGVSVLNTWVCFGAFPTKINGLELDRLSSENTIESVELTIDKIEKL